MPIVYYQRKFKYTSVSGAMAGQVHKFRRASRAGPFRCWTVRSGNGHAGRNTLELFALADGSEGAVHSAARDKFCTASAGTWPSVCKIGRLNVLDSACPKLG